MGDDFERGVELDLGIYSEKKNHKPVVLILML
ncbi:hypothetical protein VIBC2010_01408 [Vibrio caribbeanicus ATCC BAA-2122]|uniref:Uncharacterized protein n=1 Tax=Vibrio caribbeanicus ATCC BAA-2122 TaxID=796620 RepID=E3BLW3_9VIBR|nr:hypothetical protein VIBC2010_01408 [Vibrio caribbeanicus ATCC BAA-2122]